MQEENKIAVIDLGTNTCLLLISEYKNNKLVPILDMQEMPRLGKDVDKNRAIAVDAFIRVKEIFHRYKEISEEHNVSEIFAYGTSALRDAANRDEFIDYIKSETGIEISVITGKEEAEFSFNGALIDFKDKNKYAVLDIGGGSTEISFRHNADIFSKSIDIGSVRLKEKFFFESYSKENLYNAEQYILNSFVALAYLNFSELQLVGVAGTVTVLSALNMGLHQFDEEKINNSILHISEIEKIFNDLAVLSTKEIEKLGDFMKGRSDIITAGVFILMQFMKHFKFDKIITTTHGLRYGAVLKNFS